MALSAPITYSPNRQGRLTMRTIIGITGRARMPSWIVASIQSARRCSSPERTASRRPS